MKNTLLGASIAALSVTAIAAPVEVTDPARSERCHLGLESFDLKKSKYVAVDGDALLLDGNETTGRQFSAGRHQFLLSLAKPQTIDRLSLIGTGNVTFSIYVANDNAAPGASWQTILKNVKLSDRFGKDQAVNRTVRYILVDADARSIFTLNELAIYGQLTPIGGGPRYLMEVWEQRRRDKAAQQADEAKLPPIKAGPTGFFPGRLGFPPRVSNPSVARPVATGLQSAPRGVLAAPPKPAVR